MNFKLEPVVAGILHEDGYLLCPKCGFQYHHMNSVNIEAGGENRAEVTQVTIHLRGECEHEWDLVINQRKGLVSIWPFIDPD